MKNKFLPITYAILAAVLYAINTPLSKVILNKIDATYMAAFLYLGAGIGVGIMYLFKYKKENKNMRLTKYDFPYTLGMILLDIAAPIFMMFGIKLGTASNASLLGNFEIVATSLIALFIFKEHISKKLWSAISFIVISSAILSFEGSSSFEFSLGSLFVILATICWGFENNCTRKISNKSTYQIVFLKGIFSGLGSLVIGLFTAESFPTIDVIIFALVLGFLSYGLSIFTYIRAQKDLGAARTSAYYAIAPFIGVILSVLIDNEKLSLTFFVAMLFMIIGTIFAAVDTFKNEEK